MDIAYVAEATRKATVVASGHAAEATSGGVLGSLGINGTLFIFQLINFAVVALILWFLILKPLTKKMSERADMIDKSVKNAEAVEENLRHSELKYQEKIDQAKAEAAGIIAQAGVEAKDLAEKTKDKSKQEIELLVEQAKKNIKIEKEEMIGEVKAIAAQLVVAVVEKVLLEKMNDKKDKEIIANSLKGLKI